MKISQITSYYGLQNNKKTQEDKPVTTANQQTQSTELRSQFNDHLVSFGARVDKGLERFYEANKDRMPVTVSTYVEALEDKTLLTPMEAQKRAFNRLETAETIKDIKKAYPTEASFSELINPTDSKAKRGILYSVKENEELLALDNAGMLKDKSNLTVYLVKKIFLEAKTVDEINKDLENDLNEDFKADFKFKNKDSQYIYGSTINALGIKPPAFEYQQSLRYTRDGYADSVGAKISAFWDSMPTEERTARAKKSVEKFEKWWFSHTKNEMLDMIADQTTELEMLKDFKKAERAEAKQNGTKSAEQNDEQDKESPRTHTKTGSEKLSQDDLFKIWASNNLKLFEANMSEAEKDTLHIKRMQRLVERWANMNPAERTDYISKMKSGSEPLRFTMIDAWNHSKDIIQDLSTHLKANQVYKPSEVLYSTQAFSEFQSKVMTEFWQNHPEHSETLGNNIRISQEKVKTAISRGTFEELKKQIMRDKNQRVKEMDKFKAENISTTPKTEDTIPDYIKEFKIEYYKTTGVRLKNLPKEYLDDYFAVLEKDVPKEQILAWTKNLRGEQISPEDQLLLQKLSTTESKESAKIGRAIEAALAETLYDCTKSPSVYEMSHSDAKTALYKLDKGDNPIELGSLKLGRDFQLPVLKNKIDKVKIASLYHIYKEELPDSQLDEIVNSYFVANEGNEQEEIKEYLKLYRKSALIIFSEKSMFSTEIKKAFFKKFTKNQPDFKNTVISLLNEDNSFKREDDLKRMHYLYEKKFDFVPKSFMDSYFKSMARQFRMGESQVSMDDFENLCCTKRKDPKSRGKLAIFPKKEMMTETKLNSLAMEQALADTLYDATGNADVYSMQFEELCDNIELFSLVKKFPSEERNYTKLSDNLTISLVAKKKINLTNINKLYKEYRDEIAEWLNTSVLKNNRGELEDLLYILNPDENAPEKDAPVSNRIRLYGMSLDE